jgi:hypothetical protein
MAMNKYGKGTCSPITVVTPSGYPNQPNLTLDSVEYEIYFKVLTCLDTILYGFTGLTVMCMRYPQDT